MDGQTLTSFILAFPKRLIRFGTMSVISVAAIYGLRDTSRPWHETATDVCIAVAQSLGSDQHCRDALWHVVSGLCVPLHKALQMSFPCLSVDEERGYAVIRAPLDRTRVLIVPTQKIEGIESPLLLRPDAAKFWSLAWIERDRVAIAAPRLLRWSDLAMAVNSRPARSQDQLHIHLDCLDARVKRALASRINVLSDSWSLLDLRPWADRYHVRKLGPAALDQNLFKLLADERSGAAASMALQSVAVVGFLENSGERGFVVLVNSNGGQAEELLDHSCSERRS